MRLAAPEEMRIAILTTDNRELSKDYSSPVPSFHPAPEALFQGLTALPELEVHVVSCIRQPVKSPGKLADNLWCHSLHVPRIGWMRTGYQGCIRAVRKKLKELHPDIVHGQGTEQDCALDAVFSGFPNVVTIHGNMRQIARVTKQRLFSFVWLSARLESLAIRRTAGVVCITRHTQAEVAGLARRTWVVPNAVDRAFFDLQAQPRAGDPPRVLCVARVSPEKNQNAFIRALDSLAAKSKFNLLFFGQAWESSPYGAEFFRLLRARPWCSHGGNVNREELKRYLSQASLLALPSLEENCPMAVLEAMAAGVPVLAAKVGGVPDLIEEGKTGFFCDPQDPVSMCIGVEKALARAEASREVALRAKQHARERFHPNIIAQEHLKIYREALR